MNLAGQSTREMQKRYYNRRMLFMSAILLVGFLSFLILGKFLGYVHKPAIFIGLEEWTNCVIVFTNGFVSFRGKIKGVSVINAKYFPAYFERLPENKTTALWDGRKKLQGLAG